MLRVGDLFERIFLGKTGSQSAISLKMIYKIAGGVLATLRKDVKKVLALTVKSVVNVLSEQHTRTRASCEGPRQYGSLACDSSADYTMVRWYASLGGNVKHSLQVSGACVFRRPNHYGQGKNKKGSPATGLYETRGRDHREACGASLSGHG